MRKLLVALALVSAAASSALAGARWTEPVYIYVSPDGSGYVDGTLSDSRATSDGVTLLGCEVWASTVGAPGGHCFARDNAGHNVSCTLTSPDLIRTVGMINSGSRIHFNWDSTKVCNYVLVVNASYVAPLAP